MKNNLFEEKFYEIERINNFINFLKSDFRITPNKTIKDVIIEALQFTQDKTTTIEDTKLITSNHICRTRSNIIKIDVKEEK